jgi:hypothetical protein
MNEKQEGCGNHREIIDWGDLASSGKWKGFFTLPAEV